MLKVTRLIWVFFIILLCCQTLYAQQDRVDREKRIYDSANSFYLRGDYKNAIQDLNTLISTYAGGSWADEALLKLAQYYYEKEQNPSKAREYLEKVFTSYANTNSAPDAYFFLGKIILENNKSLREKNDARANFERVSNLFPESPKAAEALLMISRIENSLEQFQSAIDRLYLLLGSYPDNDIADQAQFELATNYYYLGEFNKSMQEYQRLRDKYPDSFLYDEARNRITLIFRLHFNRAQGRPVYFRDDKFRFTKRTELDDPVYLQRAGEMSFFLVDRGSGKIMTVDYTGKVTESEATRNPTMMKMDSRGNRYLLREGKLRNVRNSLDLRISNSRESYELREIKSFALSKENDLYVFDEGRSGLYRFNKSDKLLWEFKNESFKDLWDLEVNNFGNLFTLNGVHRKLTQYNPEDNRREIGFGPVISGIELRDPVCIEIDPLDNIYILDRKLNGVLILDREGKLLARFYFPAQVGEARSLAVDDSGALYLLDRRERNILRFH